MMGPTRNDNALREQGEVGTSKTANRQPTTKIGRIIHLLKNRRQGLNRFEAEAFGEHCLNSTIAVIRAMHPEQLVQRWETLPSRFTNRGVRCLRYWLRSAP